MSENEEIRGCAAMAYVGWLGAGDPGQPCGYYALRDSEFCGVHDPRRRAEKKNRRLSELLGLRDVDALIRNRRVLNVIAGYGRRGLPDRDAS